MSEAPGPPGAESGDTPDDPAPAKDLPGLAAFAAMGMTVAIIEALGVVAGLFADRTFGTAPGGLLLGIVLSTVTAVVSVLKQVRRYL